MFLHESSGTIYVAARAGHDMCSGAGCYDCITAREAAVQSSVYLCSHNQGLERAHGVALLCPTVGHQLERSGLYTEEELELEVLLSKHLVPALGHTEGWYIIAVTESMTEEKN